MPKVKLEAECGWLNPVWNFPITLRVVVGEASAMMRRMLAFCLLAAAFLAAATPAHADSDRVQFFSNINVGSDMAVHDAVCFFCNVNILGEAKGDVVVFFGNIHIAGHADHDVVNFFGSISAEDNAQIGQDMVSFFGLVRLGENVSVGKDLVAMFGMIHAPESVTVGHDRVAFPGWILFGPLLPVVLIIWLIVHVVRSNRRRTYTFPPGL
jgi:hypothetical protein